MVDVADVAVVVVTEVESKIRGRSCVRNLKITRTPSFELLRLCRILIGGTYSRNRYYWVFWYYFASIVFCYAFIAIFM